MAERDAIRSYITAADHLQYSQLADGMVQVNATHSNLKQYVMELRLDLHTTVRDVKAKLTTHNGTSAQHMVLQLQDGAGAVLAVLDDDAKPLGYYSVRNGHTLHVVDTDPFSLSRDGGLEDVSRVAKYRMSEEDYDKRDKTLRSYKREMLAKDPNFRFVPPGGRAAGGGAGGAPTLPLEAYAAPSCVAGMLAGARCEVAPGARRGTVAFAGPVAALAAGYWVGVRLDEPLGKGDGSRGGVAYFDAPDRYGAFVRPNFVTLGDFPEEAGLEEEGGGEGEAGRQGPGLREEAAAAAAGCCGQQAGTAVDPVGASGAAAGGGGGGGAGSQQQQQQPPVAAGGAAASSKAAAAAGGAGRRRRGQEGGDDSDDGEL